jgi:hypothetical protein
VVYPNFRHCTAQCLTTPTASHPEPAWEPGAKWVEFYGFEHSGAGFTFPPEWWNKQLSHINVGGCCTGAGCSSRHGPCFGRKCHTASPGFDCFGIGCSARGGTAHQTTSALATSWKTALAQMMACGVGTVRVMQPCLSGCLASPPSLQLRHHKHSAAGAPTINSLASLTLADSSKCPHQCSLKGICVRKTTAGQAYCKCDAGFGGAACSESLQSVNGGAERVEVYDGTSVLLVLMLLMLLGLAAHQLTPSSCYYTHTEYEGNEGDDSLYLQLHQPLHPRGGSGAPASEDTKSEGSYGSTGQ